MAISAAGSLSSEHLLSAPSVFAAVFILGSLLLTSGLWNATGLGREAPRWLQRLVTTGVPAAILALLVVAGAAGLSRGGWRRSDEVAAFTTLFALGFVFSLKDFGRECLGFRVAGTFFSLAFGSLLSFLIAGWWLDNSRDVWLVWTAVVCFWLLWLPIVVRLNRRAVVRSRLARGLCIWCCYNLAGNVSGCCPECGSALAGQAQVLVGPHINWQRHIQGLKRGGLVACILLAMLLVGSAAASAAGVCYVTINCAPTRVLQVRLTGGRLSACYGDGQRLKGMPSWGVVSRRQMGEDLRLQVRHEPRPHYVVIPWLTPCFFTEVSLPLWLLLLIVGVPTAWLWRHDRNRRRRAEQYPGTRGG